MNRTIVLSLFAALALAQLAVPSGMILRRETALSRGQEYKIRVQPVDPYDAFRGRFVRLGFDVTTAPLPPEARLARGQRAYAVLETDSEGFAVVKSVSFAAPDGTAYLKVRLRPSGAGKAQVIWPFDRYYMEETAAPQAEQLYRERARNSAAYITVRVSDGTGVITGLYLDGKPIEQEIHKP